MAINVLSPRVYNRIAAGEVVERPASVVKELVENSLDAGATKIKVEIEDGGIKKICIADNGCGIKKEDLPLAFMPHATSKISNIDDLDEIGTLGFRGEALASIASVSMISLTTKTKDSETGYKIEADGGEISKITEVARLDGTTLTMQNLFFNTPARAKFLKRPKSEESEITHLVEKFMMAHPEVSFEYVVDGKVLYNHASGELNEVVYLIYGRDIFENLLEVKYKEDEVSVSGFVVSPKLSRPNRTYQTLFVNGRYVENYMVSACVQGAFEPFLMKSRFPVYILKLDLPFNSVDVNVHPNKREVKFENSNRIFGIIRRAVERALISTNLIADFEFSKSEIDDFSKFNIKSSNNDTKFENKNFDLLAENEGTSFKNKIESKPIEESFVSSSNESVLDEKKISASDIPEFSNVTIDPSIKNRTGGNIYFDDPGASLLREVEISAQTNKPDLFETKNDESILKSENFVEEKFLTNKAEEIKIVGVVFKTFIITEFEDSLYVIDQHAMHERQNYEKLKKQIEAKNIAKQDMLVPYTFNLIAKDRDNFESKLENLKQIGFEIRQNENSFAITSIPFVLSNICFDKFIEDVLADESMKERTACDIINDKLCQHACKHSIRAGDTISKDEIVYLIDKMKESVALCPHGRPIIVKITKKDLEKMFKRVL